MKVDFAIKHHHYPAERKQTIVYFFKKPSTGLVQLALQTMASDHKTAKTKKQATSSIPSLGIYVTLQVTPSQFIS